MKARRGAIMKKEKHDWKWLMSKGWIKCKGYCVNVEEIQDNGFDTFYTESLDDVGITKCYYYMNEEEFPEYATEDIDEAIRLQEERDHDNEIDEENGLNDVSLCHNCGCMTHTVNDHCGKCKEAKK